MGAAHTDSVMDSAESTAELLAADREASQIIEKAIAARDTKMMSAKAEAEAEIAAFRGVLEAEYQAHSTKAESDEQTRFGVLAADTQAEIDRLEGVAAGEKGKVVDLLVKYITQPNKQPAHPQKSAI